MKDTLVVALPLPVKCESIFVTIYCLFLCLITFPLLIWLAVVLYARAYFR